MIISQSSTLWTICQANRWSAVTERAYGVNLLTLASAERGHPVFGRVCPPGFGVDATLLEFLGGTASWENVEEFGQSTESRPLGQTVDTDPPTTSPAPTGGGGTEPTAAPGKVRTPQRGFFPSLVVHVLVNCPGKKGGGTRKGPLEPLGKPTATPPPPQPCPPTETCPNPSLYLDD